MMREFMKLIENAHGPFTVDGFEQWFASNPEEWLEDDIEAMGGVEMFAEKVNSWIATLPDPLTLYRGLHVADVQSWLKNPQHTRGGLGIFWTDEYETAINENGPSGGYSRHGKGAWTNVIMVAQVPHSSIDWNATAAIRILDTEEPEITLLDGAPVPVIEVHVLEFDRERRGTINQSHVVQKIPMTGVFPA